MAGGEGSRLRPLTCDKPKPMVPVMNRPLMEYSIEHLRRHGFREIAVTLQYLPEKIKDHFGSGSRFDVNLQYYVEEEPLGTAGSVKNAASFLDETFIVVSGDALTDFDLMEAVEYHRARGSMATLVLKTVQNPLEYGVVMLDSSGRIARFLEKPGWGEVFSDTVNTGIYIIEPEVLDLVETGKMVDWSKDIFPKMLSQKKPLFGCTLEGFWCDVGDTGEYLRAHREVLDGRVRVKLKGREVEKGIWLEENVNIHPRAKLKGSIYLGSGSNVGAGAQLLDYAVLGSYTRIEERASVKKGLTWEGVFVGKGAALRGGILCNAVQLNNRSAVYEGAVIGDGSIIQEGVIIKPQIKVWPAKEVEKGVVLTESLIWGNKASRSIFGEKGIKGETNRSITPEMAVRLGAVCGSVNTNGPVLVSGDGDRSSIMLREALMAGLLSTGACAIDAGELLLPMARRAVKHLRAGGGIHVTHPPAEGTACISFLDSEGLPLSRSGERKIEQLYFREDFHRPPGELVGEAVRIPNLADFYRRELLSSVSKEKISRAGFRIFLDHPSPYIRGFLTPLLQQLGCTVITLNPGHAGSWEEMPAGRERSRWRIKDSRTAVRANSATLSAAIDPGGEKVLLHDEMGRAVQEDLYTALLSLLIFREGRGNTVAVPVNASHVVEKLAKRYHGKVLRTKTSPRFLMEAEYREQQDDRISRFPLAFDAIATLIYLLDLLAAQDLTLSALLKEIPSIRIREREISCPWKQKGKVMRRLVQESEQNKTELIDGLKVYHPQGWALIMPDSEKPSYHVYGEGYSEEASDSLTAFYVEKINRLQKEEIE